MTYLCSVVSELSNYDRRQSVFSACRTTDTGVIVIGDTMQANQCLVLAETGSQ